jgi:hypothetical protein
MVGLRFALDEGRVGIVQIVGQLALQFEILSVAVRAQALVALGDVSGQESLLVDRSGFGAPRLGRRRLWPRMEDARWTGLMIRNLT